MNAEMGRIIIVFGAVLIIVGIAFTLFSKVGLPKLPGDILIKKEGFTFYFPWVTSIIISIILSLVFYLFFRK